jgi:hypothetical protein
MYIKNVKRFIFSFPQLPGPAAFCIDAFPSSAAVGISTGIRPALAVVDESSADKGFSVNGGGGLRTMQLRSLTVPGGDRVRHIQQIMGG